jgi:hypothetical protein
MEVNGGATSLIIRTVVFGAPAFSVVTPAGAPQLLSFLALKQIPE